MAQRNTKYTAEPGLSEALVREISRQKDEPSWMLEKRLAAFRLFQKAPVPSWGPSLGELDFAKITFYVRPGTDEAETWEDVPHEIRHTFEKLGIPEAERESLAGVGAQYDSDVVYHRLKDEWTKQGVIFENMDVAVRKYSDLVRRHFMMDCVPVADHKFAMLHAAVWSGGTFIYVPPGVEVKIPLQAYFRLNAERAGQAEHTLIIVDEGAYAEYIEGCSAPLFGSYSLHVGCVELYVKEGAHLKYSSIENWSKDIFNLNTKRALVDKDGTIEWLSGNMGSCTTMLYPCSILRGEGARSSHFGVAFAGPGQNQDIGAKVIHAAPRTYSVVNSKSISRGGGVSSYRGLVRATASAAGAKSHVNCDALILDRDSVSNTYPFMRVGTGSADVAHEATVGRISEEQIFYLTSRGLSEAAAVRMIVGGFVGPVLGKLPLEYAVELQKLIETEMEQCTG